jgi:hypothetical protein
VTKFFPPPESKCEVFESERNGEGSGMAGRIWRTTKLRK